MRRTAGGIEMAASNESDGRTRIGAGGKQGDLEGSRAAREDSENGVAAAAGDRWGSEAQMEGVMESVSAAMAARAARRACEALLPKGIAVLLDGVRDV